MGNSINNRKAQQGVAPEKPASVSLRCTTAIFPVNLGVLQIFLAVHHNETQIRTLHLQRR